MNIKYYHIVGINGDMIYRVSNGIFEYKRKHYGEWGGWRSSKHKNADDIRKEAKTPKNKLKEISEEEVFSMLL